MVQQDKEEASVDNTNVDNTDHRCFMCDGPASLQCPGCGEVWFCSQTHGDIHYRPATGCFPWRVGVEEGKGRVMRATRRVAAGETLFMEEPVVSGPDQVGAPICLTCYSPVTLDHLCADCGYPMCDDSCAEAESHRAECRVLRRGSRPVFSEGETEAYHCILPLRLLLLARQDPDRFSLTQQLMDHEEERRGGADWVTTERTVVARLVEDCGAGEHEGFTREEVRRAVGVLEVNCYEVFSFIRRLGTNSCGLRGCFPAASLLSHSCVANSRHVWSTEPPYTNTCVATTDIMPGEEVLTSYVHPTASTIRRRTKLLAGWYFQCGCVRCCSRDELGTHHSTLVCPAPGCHAPAPSLLPVNPLQMGGAWECGECGHLATEEEVVAREEQLAAAVRTIADTDKYNVALWLELLDLALTRLHPHHELVIEIAKFLVPILCRGPGQTTEDFPLSLVRRKLELAQGHLSVLTIIDPGYSKSRVKVMYEVVETSLYLLFKQETQHSHEYIKKVVVISIEQITEIIKVLERLNPDKGFETMILYAAKTLKRLCESIDQELDGGKLNYDKWRNESWYLLDLCSV